MNRRPLLVVWLLFCVFAIFVNARAQVESPGVLVLSHTNIENGVVVPLCRTNMKDSVTQSNYAGAYATCTLNETLQNSTNSTVIESWNCSNRFDAVCTGLGVNSVDPGATYEIDGDHGLVLVPFVGCPDTCFFDPLDYVVAPIPIFQDSATILPGGDHLAFSVTPDDPDFVIARTEETPFVSILVNPASLNVKANDSVNFTADRTARWTLVGIGSIDPSTPLTGDQVLYKAPASIAIDSIDKLTACDLQTDHGENCTTVNIALRPLVVTVTGPPELFPSQEGSNEFQLPSYVASVSFVGTPVNTGLNWSVSDTSGASLVTMSSTPQKARLQVADTKTVKAPFDISLHACAQLDPFRCGSLTIHVPVSQVTVDQPIGADFVLDPSGQPIFDASGTLTFQANVSGPFFPEDQKPRWGIVPVPLGPNQGTIGPDPTSDFRGLYTPPTPLVPDQLNVIIKACVGGVQSQFDVTIFTDEICGFYLLQLQAHNSIVNTTLSVGSGETDPLSVTGFGFGAAPTITFADPSVGFTVSSITGPDSTGRTTVNGSVTVAPLAVTELTTLTVTSSLPPPSKPASTTFRVNAVRLTPAITPASATLLVTQSQQFTGSLGCATVGGQTCTVAQTFTCSVTPAFGVMNASTCLYTAPSTLSAATTVTGQACSTFGNKCVSLPINLVPVSVSVTPTAASLDSAQSQQFQSTVTNSPNNNQGTTWSISPAVGSISAAGLYTAPGVVSTLQTVTVSGCSVVDSSRCASAAVTLNPVAVAIAPGSVTLGQGQTQQFQATVTHSTNTGVVWSVSPAVGSISSTGLYTAPPSVTGNQAVVVKVCSSIAPANCATSTVNLIPPDFALSVSPSSGNTGMGFLAGFGVSVTSIGGFAGTVTLTATPPVGIGMSSNFSQTAVWGSGSSIVTFPVTSSTPGGSYIVTITGTSGALVHTAQINVTVLIESLSFTVSAPQTAPAGQTVTFTYTVTNNGFFSTDSVNVTGIPPGSTVTPTAWGGSGTGSLVFTTPATLGPGTYPLTFTAQTGSLSATATTGLTIPSPPPPPPPPPCTTRICLNQ